MKVKLSGCAVVAKFSVFSPASGPPDWSKLFYGRVPPLGAFRVCYLGRPCVYEFVQPRLAPQPPDVIFRDARIEFCHRLWIDEFPDDLSEDHQAILNADDTVQRRKVVACERISTPFPLSRAAFRLRLLFRAFPGFSSTPPFLRLIPSRRLLDCRPVAAELLI